jgi:hypothetical protein
VLHTLHYCTLASHQSVLPQDTGTTFPACSSLPSKPKQAVMAANIPPRRLHAVCSEFACTNQHYVERTPIVKGWSHRLGACQQDDIARACTAMIQVRRYRRTFNSQVFLGDRVSKQGIVCDQSSDGWDRHHARTMDCPFACNIVAMSATGAWLFSSQPSSATEGLACLHVQCRGCLALFLPQSIAWERHLEAALWTPAQLSYKGPVVSAPCSARYMIIKDFSMAWAV